MALYSFVCDCGEEEDRLCSYEETKNQVCSCGRPLQKRITGARLVGPTDTKPSSVGGRTFTRQSDIARWENSEAAKGLSVLSASDRQVKDKIYDIKQKAELRAQSRGYTSERARQADVKKEARAKGEKIGG